MKRRTKLLLGAAAFLTVGVGVAVWLAWFPPWAPPLEKRLLGAWEGSGTFSGDFGLDVKPDPEHDVSGGKASGRVTCACTVQAEFKPDGTYTWNEQYRGEETSKGIDFSFGVPKEGGEPARWEVIGAQGNKLTVRMWRGEVVFEFQGENAFTMNLPESTKTSDVAIITFHRSGKSKN